MFSRRSAGAFYQTVSLAAHRSHLVVPLTSPMSKKGKTGTLEELRRQQGAIVIQYCTVGQAVAAFN